MTQQQPFTVSAIRAGWNRFFFTEDRVDSLALVRVLLCAALLIPVVSRWPHAREIYSSDGVPTQLAASYPSASELPLLPGNAAVVAYTLLVFCLISGLVGWYTRASLAIAAVLMIYFGLIDSVGTLTKYTVVSMHVLGILACSNCGAVWSVDAALRDPDDRRTRFPVWPTRLLQLFLAVLYFATAVTKVRTPEYMTGEHTLFWMQTDMNFAHPVGFWLSTHPEMVIVSSYIVVLWEVLFPALCWNRVTKLPLLAVGAAFHLMTYLLLGLAIFPLIIVALYPCFLAPSKSRAVWLAVRNRTIGLDRLAVSRRAQVAWAFPIVLGLTLVTAVEAEYRLDPLGMRAEKPELPIIPRERAEQLLSKGAPSRPSDWVSRVDLGRTTFAGVVCDGETKFGPEESPILQLWMVAPHPDFFVHLDVIDAAEQTVLKDGIVVPRESLRMTTPFHLANNLPSGSYAFVLRDDVGIIARRNFVVE